MRFASYITAQLERLIQAETRDTNLPKKGEMPENGYFDCKIKNFHKSKVPSINDGFNTNLKQGVFLSVKVPYRSFDFLLDSSLAHFVHT